MCFHSLRIIEWLLKMTLSGVWETGGTIWQIVPHAQRARPATSYTQGPTALINVQVIGKEKRDAEKHGAQNNPPMNRSGFAEYLGFHNFLPCRLPSIPLLTGLIADWLAKLCPRRTPDARNDSLAQG